MPLATLLRRSVRIYQCRSIIRHTYPMTFRHGEVRFLLPWGIFDALSSGFPKSIIMPVVHGRNISEIDFSLRLITKYDRPLQWIGLGGVVPLLQRRRVTGLTG